MATDTWEGTHESPIVFIYTCPTSSKIREKMLYASCRSSVVTAAEHEAALNIDKKVIFNPLPLSVQYGDSSARQ